MKLSHNEIKKCIEFKENMINILVIENHSFFTKIIRELFYQTSGGNGNFVLSENLEELIISKKMDLAIDYFNLSLNSRRIKKELYKRMEAITVTEEHYLKSKEIKNDIIKFFYQLEDVIDFDISMNEEFDFKDLFKALKVKINENDYSFSENIIKYIIVSEKFLGIELFIFVNLKSFLDEKDLSLFYEFVFYNKHNILLIESTDNKILAQENKIIIDKDLCEIWYN